MSAEVTTIRSRWEGDELCVEITVVRSHFVQPSSPPRVEDVPADIRTALYAWLDGNDLPGRPPRPERVVKAEALREARREWPVLGQSVMQWLAARADRIERGEP